MKKLLIYLLTITSFTLSAAIPTIEGLLRNGSNEEVVSDTIVLRLKLEKKMGSPLDFTAVKEDLVESAVVGDESEKDKPVFLKLIFNLKENRPLQVLQILYNDSRMENESLVSVKMIANLKKNFLKDSNIERKLLYSLIAMYSVNDSEYFSELLKKTNSDFKTNFEMLDPEKKNILSKYQKYLSAIKEDSSLKETLESPLNVTDKDENEKVKEIMNRNMYLSNENIKLVRENGKFYWRVQLENFDGRFSNVKNHLLKLELNTPNGMIQSTVSDYILFDGTHELPKNIVIKDIIDSIYHLEVLAYNTFNSTNKSLKTRYNDYLKSLDKSPAKNKAYSKDYFLY